MPERPVAALFALALTTGGCSALLVKGPPNGSGGVPDCTTAQTIPALDLGVAAVLAYAAAGLAVSPDEEGPLRGYSALTMVGTAAVLGVSGGLGMGRVGECRRWREEQEMKRALRPFATPSLAPPGADPWLGAGAPPGGFSAPPVPAPPDGGADHAEVGP
jgi:hypothetical protein